jgi:hypothetical protein
MDVYREDLWRLEYVANVRERGRGGPRQTRIEETLKFVREGGVSVGVSTSNLELRSPHLSADPHHTPHDGKYSDTGTDARGPHLAILQD